MKVTIELTQDQLKEVREWAREKRVNRANWILSSSRPDKDDEELAYIKRIETILASKLAKS